MSVAKSVQCCAAALGIIALSNPAKAADLYGGYKDVPVYLPLPWQGFYAGLYAGGGWSTLEPANNVVILGGGSGTVPVGSLNSSGFLGGLQLGYNFQLNGFVLGVEADLGGIDTGTKGAFADPSMPARILRVKSSGDFYGDITGRAGVVLGSALLYAKGGFAFFTGDVRISDSFDRIAQDSGTFTGWTIGGGLEYLIGSNSTVKVEYQYFDFNNNNFSCCVGFSGRIENAVTSNTVKVGVNFLVHSLRSPLY